MFELSSPSKDVEPNPLFNSGHLIVWNKRPERFGDMEDKLFYVDDMNFDRKKGLWLYSGEILKIVKTSSPGVPYLPIENFTVEVPENELKFRSSYLSLVGRTE